MFSTKFSVSGVTSAAIASSEAADATADGQIRIYQLDVIVVTSHATGTIQLQDTAGSPVVLTPALPLSVKGQQYSLTWRGAGAPRGTANKSVKAIIAGGGKAIGVVHWTRGRDAYIQDQFS